MSVRASKWKFFLRKRNDVFRYTPSNETTTNRPLSDLSTDLLVMSRNQLGKRGYIKIATMLKDIADARTFRMADISLPVSILTTTTNQIREWKRLKRINLPRERWKWCHQEPCMPFHPFHQKLQSRMTNFNFLAQPAIITILHSLRYLQQNRSQNPIWFQSLSSLDGIVVSKCELWERGCCMDWELVVNDMWRGCLLNSRNSSNLQFFFLLVQVEMVYSANRFFVSRCYYDEILNYKHNTITRDCQIASRTW